jgi:hypothetical protein
MNVSALCKKVIGTLAIASAALGATGCGEFVRSSRSPSQLVIESLEAASGASSSATFGTTLESDVVTIVNNGATVFSDAGRVSLRLMLRDPGAPGIAATPSAINQVTITRYRIVYRRADGRNTPGVDVPQPFDSALTVTVPTDGDVRAGFEFVRHAAKEEAPLFGLRNSAVTISTIAEVTFYGHDQAGNEVSVTGSIGVIFGNFADPS